MKLPNNLIPLLSKTFDKFLGIFLCITLGFGYGRGSGNVSPADVPFLIIVSLLMLAVSVVVDFFANLDDRLGRKRTA